MVVYIKHPYLSANTLCIHDCLLPFLPCIPLHSLCTQHMLWKYLLINKYIPIIVTAISFLWVCWYILKFNIVLYIGLSVVHIISNRTQILELLSYPNLPCTKCSLWFLFTSQYVEVQFGGEKRPIAFAMVPIVCSKSLSLSIHANVH